MSSTTQMMNNTTEVEYISIYDRPKRGKGRPKTCTLTEEQKKQKAIERSLKYYYDNREYCLFRQKLYDEQKKIKFRKPIIFLAF